MKIYHFRIIDTNKWGESEIHGRRRFGDLG